MRGTNAKSTWPNSNSTAHSISEIHHRRRTLGGPQERGPPTRRTSRYWQHQPDRTLNRKQEMKTVAKRGRFDEQPSSYRPAGMTQLGRFDRKPLSYRQTTRLARHSLPGDRNIIHEISQRNKQKTKKQKKTPAISIYTPFP